MALSTAPTRERVPASAWRMLALGVSAQAAGSLFLSTPAYLIPLLHLDRGVPLAQAGLLAAAPSVGMVMALVAWGAVTDRYGERWVIAGGLALTAVFAFAAAAVPGYVGLGIFFVLGGAAAASTSAASGRVVIGWFPRSRRGLAMGIRQISQPLGVAVAALAVPPLASGLGIWAPLLLAGALTAVLAAACAVGIANPPRVGRQARRRRRAAVQPVPREPVPDPHPPAVGAAGGAPVHAVHLRADLAHHRPALECHRGRRGDRRRPVHRRPRPHRGRLGQRPGGQPHPACCAGSRSRASSSCWRLAGCGGLHWAVASAVVLIVASTVSVADNGLSFTSVAEAAGPSWSGKALGIQNTGQFIAASAVGPGIGALITAVGYPVAFALVALAPLAAVPLVPARDKHSP